MNNTEAFTLLRYVVACCPAQKIDEYTPDAWTKLLGDLRFVDCEQAVTNLAQEQEFIAPKDVRKEVKRIRTKRIDTHGPFDPPDPDMSVAEYLVWQKQARKIIADGGVIEAPQLGSRDTAQIRAIDKRPA